MILLLAGLQEIPKDYYEAATMDGATPIKKLFSITLPLLSPQIFFVLVTSIISSLQVFDTIYMMILNTSPAYDSTVSLVYLFYNNTSTTSLSPCWPDRLADRFPDFKVDVLHGQLNKEEQEAVMDRFKQNQVQILVATTMVEVGVDVW